MTDIKKTTVTPSKDKPCLSTAIKTLQNKPLGLNPYNLMAKPQTVKK